MKKTILSLFIVAIIGSVSAQSKFQQDRKAIEALAGFYKVTFDYSETFAPDTAYKFHPKYHSWGYEWAVIAENSPKKIVIQHLLVVGDSTVIKHWREDWEYESPTLLAFDKENTWKKTKLTNADTKGKWVQRVYQVDDSPRYEGIGTWVHVDGRDEWHSETDSPLPRREFTKRSDYNVLRRSNRVYLTSKGWMFEQDNQKIIRSASGDKLLAREKGYEEFVKADPEKFAYAQNWWKEQQAYWTDVRKVWEGIYAATPVIKIQGKKDGKVLFERLFDLGDQSVKEKWSSAKNKEEVKKVIDSYMAAA